MKVGSSLWHPGACLLRLGKGRQSLERSSAWRYSTDIHNMSYLPENTLPTVLYLRYPPPQPSETFHMKAFHEMFFLKVLGLKHPNLPCSRNPAWSSLICCSDKRHGQRQFRAEGYSRFTLGRELKQKSWRNAVWRFCWAIFITEPRTTYLLMTPPAVDWALRRQLAIRTMAQGRSHKPVWGKQFFSWDSLF